jgi:hypothetical protein
MKNPSSLLLTLVSYLITLATIIFLLFAVMPPSLKAQTNADIVAANAAVTNTVAPVVAGNSQAAHAPAVRVDAPAFHINGDDIKQSLAIMIPIIAIVMGCSIPIAIVALSLYFRHRKNIVLHETVRTMVEKGVPIPPEMFKNTGTECTDSGRADRPRNDLRKGLILLGIGIGVVMLAGKAGYIILFLGVAFVVASFFEKNSDNQPPKQ